MVFDTLKELPPKIARIAKVRCMEIHPTGVWGLLIDSLNRLNWLNLLFGWLIDMIELIDLI